MGILKRGFKNAFRNVTRTVSIVLILGLSIGLALTMLIARQAVEQRIASVKASTGNTISVSPAGMRGFEGSGNLLTAEQISTLSSLSHVSKVIALLTDRLTQDTNTSLTPSQEMGDFGRRQERIQNNDQGSASTSGSTNSSSAQTQPKMPITLTGTNSLDASALSVSSITYTSGKAFDATKDENVAIVGKTLASKNSLSVGSTFTVYGATVTVVGIYDTGNNFTNSALVMPLAAVQRLTSQTGEVSAATVVADSIDNLSSVKTAITSKLGSDKVDVTTSQESASTIISQFDSIKNITFVSLVGSLAAGAVIILLTMMMVARERRREIGVLKAIGATDFSVISQFAVESLTLTGLGSIIGLAIGVTASSTVMNLLVTNSTTTGGRQGGGFAGRMMDFAGQGMNSLRNIQTAVGWDIILYGVGAALLIAIVGSVVPAWFISKIRPAEVMRAE